MYLALAVELDCRFVTADRRFMQHVGGTKHAHRILWIEDIPASS